MRSLGLWGALGLDGDGDDTAVSFGIIVVLGVRGEVVGYVGKQFRR